MKIENISDGNRYRFGKRIEWIEGLVVHDRGYGYALETRGAISSHRGFSPVIRVRQLLLERFQRFLVFPLPNKNR